MTVTEWALIASNLIAVLSFAYAVASSRDRAKGAKVRDLEARIDKLEDRATRTERDMAHLPSKDAAHKLEVALTRLEGEMGSLRESIKPVSAMASRIQEALIEKVASS